MDPMHDVRGGIFPFSGPCRYACEESIHANIRVGLIGFALNDL